ncbi:MAG: hypothetical protein QOH26_1973 [Actinomycetota bacterium]|jgi:hypothetical protein|nr:hypothetical protein [Actinomycetota bacterium]
MPVARAQELGKYGKESQPTLERDRSLSPDPNGTHRRPGLIDIQLYEHAVTVTEDGAEDIRQVTDI